MTDDDYLRLKALALVQIADDGALLAVLEQLAPGSEKVFLEQRKKILHTLLESYETTDPALAAVLQETIDHYSKNYPFDYD